MDTTIRDLVLQARDNGLTYRQMVAKVEAAEKRAPTGRKVSHATLNNIARGVHNGSYSPEVIRAIACIADVPEQRAFQAAGHRHEGPPFADELPSGVDQLDMRERRIVLDLIRELLSRHEAPIRFSPTDSDEVVEAKIARVRALLPDAFVDGTPDQDVMDAAFGEDPEYRAHRAQTHRDRLAYLRRHPDERLPDDPVEPWAGGLRAARHQTDPGQTLDDDVGGA